MRKYILIAFIVGVILGLFLNKQDYKTIVKEVPGKTIKEVVYLPPPKIEYEKLNLSTIPHYVFKEIVKTDTITNVVTIDTLAILRDYTAIKNYSYTLFNNEHGELILDQKTQYNSIVYTDYTYMPIKRVETTLKKWQLLVGAGYNSDNYIGPSFGVLFKDVGVVGGYKYNFNRKKRNIDISVLISIK